MVVLFKPTSPITLLLISLRLFIGFMITYGMRFIYHHPMINRLHGTSLWMSCFGICLIISIFEGTIYKLDNLYFFNLHGPNIVRLQFIRAILISVWSIFYFGFHLLEDNIFLKIKALESDKANLKSEMGRLQAQMNPHFLFNALNAVMAIRHDPQAVEEVTQSLAEYLRFSLEPSQQFEPLARELESLEKYFTVQQARFGSDLACAIQCDRDASEVRVPPMILQPVLENAFNYGKRPEDGPLQVRVAARVLGERLHITISNTGNWLLPDSTKSSGIGIRNLRERFRILYEDSAKIEITQNHGWVFVDIDLPTTPPPNVILNPAA